MALPPDFRLPPALTLAIQKEPGSTLLYEIVITHLRSIDSLFPTPESRPQTAKEWSKLIKDNRTTKKATTITITEPKNFSQLPPVSRGSSKLWLFNTILGMWKRNGDENINKIICKAVEAYHMANYGDTSFPVMINAKMKLVGTVIGSISMRMAPDNTLDAAAANVTICINTKTNTSQVEILKDAPNTYFDLAVAHYGFNEVIRLARTILLAEEVENDIYALLNNFRHYRHRMEGGTCNAFSAELLEEMWSILPLGPKLVFATFAAGHDRGENVIEYPELQTTVRALNGSGFGLVKNNKTDAESIEDVL